MGPETRPKLVLLSPSAAIRRPQMASVLIANCQELLKRLMGRLAPLSPIVRN